MSDDTFDVEGWPRRIGHSGPREPVLSTLRTVIAAHTATIPFENMVAGGRGGYCFEQNPLLLAGLGFLGFRVTGLLARVIRGMGAYASGPAMHMVVQVDLPERPFLADVGFGNQTPTAPLAMRPVIEQETPHETIRLWPVGDELTLQAKLGEDWQSIPPVTASPAERRF
jgi:N-hydroxyarylamine O-acetyltransferase